MGSRGEGVRARVRGACPGYVIDHVIALKRGGADAPSNMQWQTVRAAKAKDGRARRTQSNAVVLLLP
jgi:hypothetical protein